MNKYLLRTLSFLLFGSCLLLTRCSSDKRSGGDSIADDSLSIAQGKNIFDQSCAACHSIDRDGIGPALGGITEAASPEWLMEFIRNPKAVIESGDARAVQASTRYKSVMPSFAYYTDGELESIIAYLHTEKAAAQAVVATGGMQPLENPIPAGITMSDLVVEITPVVQMPATAKNQPRARITKYATHPLTKELLVLDLRGKLYRLKDGHPEVYMDMQQLMPRFINAPGHATGFGSFAFHPDFRHNGLLYTTHTEAAGSQPADFVYDDTLNVKLQWVLSEWKTASPTAFPFSGERRELLRINMIGQSHGVQEITFNPLATPGDEDFGLLYIGVGDGGSAERGILHINKGPEHVWSSILRIDPAGSNSRNGKYGIPESNPFFRSDNPKALGEVYAFGFRNPHRITWTRSGKMLASNIGQHNIEELNLILAGHNYGWPSREGSFVINLKESTHDLFPLPADDAAQHFDYPVAEYDHDEGNAIIGGYEYWGESIDALKGKYLFGDMVNGRLFYVEEADVQAGRQAPMREWSISLNGKKTSFKQLCDAERLSMRFGRDDQGEIYISTMPDGQIYKLVQR